MGNSGNSCFWMKAISSLRPLFAEIASLFSILCLLSHSVVTSFFLKNARNWLYICHVKVWSTFLALCHQDPHCSDVTLCGWQDVKVHELTNLRCSDVTLFGWQDVKVHELTNPHYSDVTLCGWQDVKVHELTNPCCSEVTLCGCWDVKVQELTFTSLRWLCVVVEMLKFKN